MKIFPLYLFFLIISIYSCKEKSHVINQDQEQRKDSIVNNANRSIDPILQEAIDELINYTSKNEIGEISLDSLSIAILFSNHKKNKIIFKSDSVVFVNYYTANIDINDYIYKGSLIVNNHKILIFDSDNIGLQYYDSMKLFQTDLNNIYQPDIKIVLISPFVIHNDSIIKWKGI